MNYLRGEALYDIIPIIPLQALSLNGWEVYFNLVKIIRLRKGVEKLNINELMQVIKAWHSKQIEKQHRRIDLSMNELSDTFVELQEDLCKIKEKVVLKNFLETFKLFVIIGCISYFFAMIFKVITEIEHDLGHKPGFEDCSDPAFGYFIDCYGLDD